MDFAVAMPRYWVSVVLVSALASANAMACARVQPTVSTSATGPCLVE
ncbi:Uncharacterised protein [Mycobacteroides abscessus subsp. massiliense]|nr:Uncharacterised protein [Mycobacteroides abscessus subsp. massiliense]